ncbi:radical SAM family heme chaperone HemW [Clostridium sp. AM58-1XD]|uniref:radical SAM family heme chaperone HemW n=1 Tax=Clostridium sp. AM58-1XD TaxID=2292307 RepID=UPI000E48219A|nr:radical SAM family heme chaperone HemW [Clostridium sp. AM58-1XD]RGZ01795.1 oxygen-independent coproporphyrinogen III oxidase [Clostridium sp. AM58-1XD]
MKNKKKLELYIHIPFCARKCEYCDFLSFVTPAAAHRAYADKLIEEIRAESAGLREYEVSSIFIGGGTPSVLPSECIVQILAAVWDNYDVMKTAEITIEANPGTLTQPKLADYRLAGINRISLGLQSADDWELRVLGRIHTYDEFLKSYQRVRLAGFDNVNVDLMSALPGQTVESWEKTLKKVLMLKPEHISAYSLIVEEGTPFYEIYGKGENAYPPLPDEETERQMYYLTKEILARYGYQRYEISNYAKPGKECRHNIGYWTGVDYIGLGLGASSYVSGYRFCKENDLRTYLDTSTKKGFPGCLYQDISFLDTKEKMEEFMFLGLRMMEGVSGSEFASRFGQNMWNVYGQQINKLRDEGLLEVREPRIWLTDRGIDVSNYALSEFIL